MFISPKLAFVKAGIAFAAIVGMGCTCWAASCTGPEALEAKVQAAPSAMAYTELGSWFEQHGQAPCALESYRAAVKIDPHSRIALDRLAKSLIAGGDPSGAIALLKSAQRDEELTLDLASAYEKAGMAEKASDTLVAALRANPSSARMTNALILILANHGHLEDAYQLAEKFAALHPHDADAQKVYLRVLVATNQATALPLARKLLAASPRDAELLFLNAVLELKAGEFSAARGHLEQSIAMNPDVAESRYNLGLALARLQDAAGAKQQLEKAIALGANEPEAHLELSKALRTLGETQEADAQLKLYQQAMQANVNREMAASKSADAAQALAGGDAQKAVALYREALEATPRDASLQYQLATALDKTGDSPGEQAALEQAVEIDPGVALAQARLGYLLYRGGDYDGAEKHFRLAISDDPGLTQAWISLASTLASKSQYSAAQEAVGHALRLDPHNAEALEMKKELAAVQPGH